MAGSRRLRRLFVLAAGIAVLVLHVFASGVPAAGLATLLDPFSPFFVFPPPQAEARATPTWVWLISCTERVPSLRMAWDLKNDLALERDGFFFDWMVKLQVGRWGARLHGNMRDFKGQLGVDPVPGRFVGETRFEYDGLRLGGDLDLIQRWGVRVGINADADLYAPVFWQSFVDIDGVVRSKRLTPDWPTTMGVHIALTSGPTFRGISGAVEARARWPIRGASVTDWEISGGFTLPQLHFGTIGFQSGYRRTSIEFKDKLTFNGVLATTEFQIEMGGWFVEMVYYY